MIVIVPITKDEAMFLRRCKVKAFITKPTTNGKRYMEEQDDAMRLLKEYRSGDYVTGGNK